jgi:hypothetical protein
VRYNSMEIAKKLFVKLDYFVEVPVDGRSEIQ